MCFAITKMQSQTSIIAGYNLTHSGHSITLGGSRTIKAKHEFGGGFRYNLNRIKHPDDQNNAYLKRLYATKPIHHFGIEGYYHFYFLNKLKHIKPFTFYDIQVTYSTTRNRMFLPYCYDTDGSILYKEYIEFFGPFTWVEQNIGIGFKADLFNNIFIYEKMGFGVAYILGHDDKDFTKIIHWFSWEFSPLINLGIGYRFNHKK